MVDRLTVTEAMRETPVAYNKEVLVAGGGVAGISAALGAAKCGAEVLLVDSIAYLGGVATAALVSEFGGQGGYKAMSGVAKELADRLIASGGANPGHYRTSFDPELFKVVAFQMMREHGVQLLLHTWIAGTVVEDGRVQGVIVENKSGRQAVLAKRVVDATGDADVAFRCGCPCVKGREEDGKMRPFSLMFRMANVDVRTLLEYVKENMHDPTKFSPDPSKNIMDFDDEYSQFRPVGFFHLVTDAKDKGDLEQSFHYLRIDSVSTEKSTCIVNATRIYDVDGTKAEDLTFGYEEGLRQAYHLVNFLNKYIPGFSSAYLVQASPDLGVRETRRIVGDYILTKEDIVDGVDFPDAIAKPSVRFEPHADSHSPDGREGAVDHSYIRRDINTQYWFKIPYRSLLPKKVENLLVVGRCLSATHSADSWTRVIPACCQTGQAGGVAAALSLKNNVIPRHLDVTRLQRTLKDQGLRL
jgi:hypothetical protein